MNKLEPSEKKYTKTEYAIGIGAFGAAMFAGCGVAHAAPLDALSGSILRGEAPIIRHNTHLQGSMSITCHSGHMIKCTIKARSRRTGHVRFQLKLNVKRIRSHRQLLFEDYSGWMRHNGKTYYLDPPCQPASPCVDG